MKPPLKIKNKTSTVIIMVLSLQILFRYFWKKKIKEPFPFPMKISKFSLFDYPRLKIKSSIPKSLFLARKLCMKTTEFSNKTLFSIT